MSRDLNFFYQMQAAAFFVEVAGAEAQASRKNSTWLPLIQSSGAFGHLGKFPHNNVWPW